MIKFILLQVEQDIPEKPASKRRYSYSMTQITIKLSFWISVEMGACTLYNSTPNQMQPILSSTKIEQLIQVEPYQMVNTDVTQEGIDVFGYNDASR